MLGTLRFAFGLAAGLALYPLLARMYRRRRHRERLGRAERSHDELRLTNL